jgi:hypothetical protein
MKHGKPFCPAIFSGCPFILRSQTTHRCEARSSRNQPKGTAFALKKPGDTFPCSDTHPHLYIHPLMPANLAASFSPAGLFKSLI